MIKNIISIGILFLLTICHVAAEVKPRLFLTQEQIERAKSQMNNPLLTKSFEKFNRDLSKNLREWRKILPERTNGNYSMEELFDLAKTRNTRVDLMTESAAMVLMPSQECETVLREKMLYEIGIHRNEGSWRQLGIHQGERLARFLQAYDLVANTDMFNKDEKQTIKDEIHQAARFLQAWCLEGTLSHVDQGQTFCFNIKYYPICMLGIVGLYFPDFPESDEWVEQADDLVLRLLLTENFIDGGYGENSIHYWAPTNHGLLLNIIANKNLGHRDYMKEPAFRNFYSKFVRWRADLTTTDGRKVAIGDAHRCDVGSEEMMEAAYLLNDGELAWIVKSIHERVNGGYLLSPHALLSFNAGFELKKPAYKSANYIWSGYGMYRSGWDADDNYLMMKYGPTWAGRRELEKYPVIAGHSHQDCMEIEMLFKGIPMLVDGGYRGRYADYDTYGGYWKATIAHNTVGLGNDYGYSRTDGLFDEHVKKHGKEFRYEKEQINTYRNSVQRMAYSDVETAVLLSAKATTYEDVEHERSVFWLRDNSLTVVFDRMMSDKPQNYELYMNLVEKRLSEKEYIFGDEKAKIEVVPITVGGKIDVIGKGTKGIPDYYYPFRPGFRGEPQWDGPNARWMNYMLMVESKRADTTSFFNILIPYLDENPYKISNIGSAGKKLSNAKEEIYITEKTNDKDISVDGRFGIVHIEEGLFKEYVLSNGYELALGKQKLINSTLSSTAWNGLYDHKVTGMVNPQTKRATFVLNPDPWNEHVMLYNPKIEDGKEAPVPIRVAISFYIGKKPKKMIWERSSDRMPEVNRELYNQKIELGKFNTGLKNYDVIDSRLSRKQQEFEYNEKTGIVTVILPDGFNQLVWE